VVKTLNQAEKVVYDGVALALRVRVGRLFFSVETSMLVVFEIGPLEMAPTILDQVLLIFNFVE
jgi:hypothetical protein